jgi:CysZ protein
MTTIPDLRPRGPLSDLLAGARLPLQAAAAIARSPRLLGLSLVGALVTAATLVAVGVGSTAASGALADWLIGGGGAWKTIAHGTLRTLSWVVFFAAGALTAPNLLLAPLQDPLSEATESACGDFTPPPFSLGNAARGTLESLAHTLLRLAFMAGGLLALLPLHLVPGVGSVAWLAASSLWSAFWVAVEHLSNPAARHLQPFGQVVTALRARLALALGFGGCLSVILWVPLLNFFLMPLAVVAGTLLFRGLEGNGRPALRVAHG